jgi:hypothetical protein
MPANICPIVPSTLLKAGVTVEFVDTGDDLHIDRERVLDITKQHKHEALGLIFVRAFGAAYDETWFFNELRESSPGLLLIDDRCLCPPDPNPESTCNVADVTLFSNGPRKYLDLGSGGYAHLGDRVAYSRFTGDFSEQALEELERGYKEATVTGQPFVAHRTDWLDLSLLGETWSGYQQLVVERLPLVRKHKQTLNAIYSEVLPKEIQLPSAYQGWRFNITVGQPATVISKLFEQGLFASNHFASLGRVFTPDEYPKSESSHAQLVNLFNDFNFDEQMAERGANIILRHLSG